MGAANIGIVLVAFAVFLQGCSSQPAGPLATYAWPAGVDADNIFYTGEGAIAKGRISVTERCVVLHDELRDLTYTLLWHEDQVEFEAESKVLLYSGSRFSRTLVLNETIRYSFQGSEVSLEYEGITKSPHADCPQRFLLVRTIGIPE